MTKMATSEIVSSFYQTAVEAINRLELEADIPEAEASGVRWKQAEKVVEALASGLTQQQIADGWRRADGTMYSQAHVSTVVKTWKTFYHLGDTDRPRWNDAYHSDEVRRRAKKERGPTPPPPPGTFSVLYADPPWEYEHSKTDSRRIENQYPTMDLEDIKTLVIPTPAPDSVLFLWATSPKLYEAMQVLDAWGFTYRTCMVWVKDKIGMGYYARQRHELLLIAGRGSLPVPEPADRPDSVIMAPRGEHSQKPAEVYGLIEAMYPNLPRIELFARIAWPGWEAWGLEAPI